MPGKKNTHTDNSFLQVKGSRKKHMTRDDINKTFAEELLTDENQELFDIDKNDLQISRDYFINQLSFYDINRKRGVSERKHESTIKMVLRPFRKILQKIDFLQREITMLYSANRQLRNNLEKERAKNKELFEELNKLYFPKVEITKEGEGTILINDKRYYRIDALGLDSRLVKSLRNYDVVMVGKTTCLTSQFHRNVRGLGDLKRKELKKAIADIELKNGPVER